MDVYLKSFDSILEKVLKSIHDRETRFMTMIELMSMHTTAVILIKEFHITPENIFEIFLVMGKFNYVVSKEIVDRYTKESRVDDVGLLVSIDSGIKSFYVIHGKFADLFPVHEYVDAFFIDNILYN